MQNNDRDLYSISIDLKDVKKINELYLLKFNYQVIIGVILGLFIMFICYWFFLLPKFEQLSASKQEEIKLKDSYKTTVYKLATLPTLRAEIEQIKQSSADILKELPTDLEVANVVQEFYQAGAKNGLRINVNTPLKPIKQDSLIIVPYEIETSGSYIQLKNFCNDIGKLDTLIVLSEISLTPGNALIRKTDKNRLYLKVKANSYQADNAIESK